MSKRTQLLGRLKYVYSHNTKLVLDVSNDDIRLIIEGVEKQVAKKPKILINDKDVKVGCVTFRKGVKTYKCICGCWVTLSQDYCSQCGQKIDWSEVE
jgi:hypothetical protein